MTTEPAAASGRQRPRRSCLAVPGSSPRFLEKAQSLPAIDGPYRQIRMPAGTGRWPGGRRPWASTASGCSTEAGGARGWVMLGDEMIDEASRKMALVIAGQGRAAGLPRTATFEPPR